MELRYYKDLDALRGLAALMVMWFHLGLNGDPVTQPVLYFIQKVSVFGQTGVTLFFVLSGFLITRILFYIKSQPHYFRNFYIKRALRIFPLYYLAVGIYYYFDPMYFSAGNAWICLVYLQNWSDTFNWGNSGPQHFWSLAVEEHFYLFWPVLVYLTPQRHFVKMAAVVIALAFLCRIVLIHLGYGTFSFTFSTMDCLVIGALLAWVEFKGVLKKINLTRTAMISFVLLLTSWFFFNAEHLDFVQVIKLPATAFFYAAAIGSLISRQTWVNKLFSGWFLRFTGKISYGLYVFHPLAFQLFVRFLPGKPLLVTIAGSFAFSYLIATASFYLYERHFIKLKKYFEPVGWKLKQGAQFK